MRVVVCVKQVPGVSSVSIDPVTKRLLREGVASVLNPFDYYALEEGVRLKESLGGELFAISMGPPKAEESLREALAFGADKGILLSDRRFAGSDTWATSYALALAIRKIGKVDLVLCGRQAVDGDTAQVPSGIAAHLNWSQASGVTAVERPEGRFLKLRRMASSGYELCEIALPGVLSTVKELNEPRVPRLAGWRRAAQAAIETWNADAIGAEPELLGLNGSPTRVVKTFAPPSRKGATRLLQGAPEDSAKAIFDELRLVAGI